MKLNLKFWRGKKILITGHTGFKGGWISVLLSLLNCKLYGYALDPKGKDNFFKHTGIKKLFKKDIRHNICDLNYLKKKVDEIKPHIIIHLAAQSSVIESFKNPIQTIFSNTIGTVNILEAAKNVASVKSILLITTDKVYQNYKTLKYFDENSKLGGDDVYSGSKACCEILSNSYLKSFYSKTKCNIATVRAGNCFGGGDWTEDRIVKDCLESLSKNKSLYIRNPNSTRPWQHVIEPLLGYILLIQNLSSRKGKNFLGAWNFGPSLKQNLAVIKLAHMFKNQFFSKSKIVIKKNFNKYKSIKLFESKYLNINSKKAKKQLKWNPKLKIQEAVQLTVDWYKAFKAKKNLLILTKSQISNYIKTTKLL